MQNTRFFLVKKCIINLIEVDEELKELFDDWRSLTEEQKKAVKVMINTFKK